MQSAFVEIGLERAAFLHIADIWEHRQNGHGGTDTRPIERILHEGQSLLVQVIKDPIGTKGARLSTQVSLAGRLLVYLPQDSHIGISQRIEDEAERESLRDKLQQLLPEGLAGGFIIRTMAETATEREMAERHRVPDQAVERPQRAHARGAGAGAALPGPEPRAARAARHGDRGDRRASSSIRARPSSGCRSSPASYTPALVERIAALRRRAAAVRPARRRGRDREGAGAARRPEVRRLPDHRPDRGDDDDRRQHRRLRRRPQLRRHDLQDQPRGGAGDRAAAAAAQPRRHHHHRLHRHGERRPPRRRAGRAQPARWSATARGSPSTASRSWAWSR